MDTALTISPKAKVRWRHDAFGNSIAVAEFSDATTALQFHSTIEVELYPRPDMEVTVEDYARILPFAYSADEIGDLGRTNERHFVDPGDLVPGWSRGIMGQCPSNETWDILLAMTRAIKSDFAYEARVSEGVQDPVFTLPRRAGSCRDFAVFLMEAARGFGLAARFVTGYLYDPMVDGGHGGDAVE